MWFFIGSLCLCDFAVHAQATISSERRAFLLDEVTQNRGERYREEVRNLHENNREFDRHECSACHMVRGPMDTSR